MILIILKTTKSAEGGGRERGEGNGGKIFLN